jgi:hypothetical protein
MNQIRDKCKCELANEDVYMGPTLGDFTKAVILRLRSGGGGAVTECKYDAV